MTSAGDEFEALFEEVAAQRAQESAAAAPAAAPEAPAPVTATGGFTEEEIAQLAEKPMFERLGSIVRMLHDSLRELGYDRSLSDVASQIGDAKGRLEYIATLTEQAANKVLNAIDASMPSQDTLSKTAKDMEERWNALFEGRMSVEEFKVLAADSRKFATQVAEQFDRLLAALPSDELREIARLRLEEHTNAEIAGRLGCTERTVERKLVLIRSYWESADRA